MTDSIVLLALGMWMVTYPSRALPLLTTRLERLPTWATDYLRLVGPAVLAALAAVGAVVATGPNGPRLEVGVVALAVVVCAAVVTRWRNLLMGLGVAVLLAAALRAFVVT